MGRPRTIDRDKVLEAAEAIVLREGATALTFEAVAKASGITKGGLQYCFGTKDDLVAALVERWMTAMDAELAESLPQGPTPWRRPATTSRRPVGSTRRPRPGWSGCW